MNDILFSRESVAKIWDEIQPLLERHAAEIAHYKDIPLSPDKDIYFEMDRQGSIRVYTARKVGVGQLVGYAIFFVRRALHYTGSVLAQQDVLFIDHGHRGFGSKFIAWCDDELRRESVQVVSHHLKAAHNWSKILSRQGYELQDLIYTKRLDR